MSLHTDAAGILDQDGTAEGGGGITAADNGANGNAGDGGKRTTAIEANTSFEFIPRRTDPPPGRSEEELAELMRARRTPDSPVASSKGDDDKSDAMVTLLMMMQRQMDVQMQMLKKIQERDERLRRETGGRRETRDKKRFRGVQVDIKYFSRVETFRGDHVRFRDWIFNVNTVIGQID